MVQKHRQNNNIKDIFNVGVEALVNEFFVQKISLI